MCLCPIQGEVTFSFHYYPETKEAIVQSNEEKR